MYDRKIIYLHRYEREMDKGNVGYIKVENRDGTCTFNVMLMNLPPSYEANTNLVIMPNGHTLCKVNIKEGKGQGMAICEEGQLSYAGVPYEEIRKFEIAISEDTNIKGEVIPLKKAREEVAPILRENAQEKMIVEENSSVQEESLPIQEESRKDVEAAWLPDNATIYKDKWEQLSSGRKKVNLMGKESDYIEITPKDMIALSNPYHSLVNNAFLLHGYYNYNHLILGPAKGHKSTFFIGVPGNFYKQEVNAARMFGFEYFENGRDKVEIGDFGYYMKKVRL